MFRMSSNGNDRHDVCATRRKRFAIATAVTQVVLEALEDRRLFTTYSYTVPSGHTVAYLKATGFNPGEVGVALDSPTATFSHTFVNVTGMDIIDAGSNSGFLFVDKVHAVDKPTLDGNSDSGIKVQGGSGCTLRIEAGDNDTQIEITASTSTSSTITTIAASDDNAVGIDKIGSTVTDLYLRTNDVSTALGFYPDDGTNVKVSHLASTVDLKVDTGLGTFDQIDVNGVADANITGVTIKTGAGNDLVNLLDDNDEDGSTIASVDFGAGSGSGNGLGLGNTLNVHTGAVATLAQFPGSSSHTIVVDTINVSSGSNPDSGALFVSAASTVGHIAADVGTDVVVSAPLSVLSSGSTDGVFLLDGQAEFSGASAPSTIQQFEITGAAESSSGAVVLDSDADVTVLTSSRIGALTISEDALMTLQQRSASPTSSGSRVLTVRSVDLGSPTVGTIDLKDNDLLIDYSSTTPIGSWNGTHYTGVAGYIASGFNAGAWSGNGIVTSMSPAIYTNHLTGLGLDEASHKYSISGSDTVTWRGQTIDATTVLIKYTYRGDADLNGLINGDDYFWIDGHVNTPGASDWFNGDFDYNGHINGDDYFQIDTNILAQSGTL